MWVWSEDVSWRVRCRCGICESGIYECDVRIEGVSMKGGGE